MEQQVAEAALAMVRPTTDSATRANASQFLENWNKTAEAWPIYVKWLASFVMDDKSNNNMEVMGTQLLCVTLLKTKIQREVPRGTTDATLLQDGIYAQLLSLLQRTNDASSPLLKPLCVCAAALAVRCNGGLQEIVGNCQSATTVSPLVALRLLSCIPAEVEACRDLTTPQVTELLLPYMEGVLDTCRRALASPDTMQPSLEALHNWAQTCHVTLSHLNSPTCGGTESLLPLLIHILSQPSQPQEVFIHASRALTEAIVVPTDSCTPAREQAVATMLNAISRGFIAAPVQANLDDNDVCHALSTLICTLVTEEVDYVCTQPAEPLLLLLLQLQAHSSVAVTIPVLECWLTVQEVPMNERHDHWKAPLYRQVVEGLVSRIAYPTTFTTWEEELDLDHQEFTELRRMVTDVLISCYFLLRVEFTQSMSRQQSDWTKAEASLYSLCCISREVCARVKAAGGGTLVRADRDATAQQLLQLVQDYIETPVNNGQHELVKRGIASFVGAYAPAWNVHCTTQAILQLLAYLRSNGTMTEEAAKATRSIYVACSNKLLTDSNQAALLSSMKDTVEAVLSTDDEACMEAVVEGSTRLIVQVRDKSVVRQYLGSLVIMPLMQRADAAADATTAFNMNPDAAVVALVKYLHILQVIIRFCDVPPENGETHVLTDAVNALWPFLDKLAQQCGQYHDVLAEVLAVHGRLLNTVQDLVAPNFTLTLKFVVDVFERTKLPSALEYISGAVEAFGSAGDDSSRESFQKLLEHVSTVLVSYLSTEKRPDECAQTIRAFFEMTQRYVLFYPVVLISSQNFATIVCLAVECLTACHGERESVRATLNFLSKLFGWRSLPLSSALKESIQAVSGAIDEQLLRHGEAVTKACIDGLAGGPQMLWPSISDCLFAITLHVAGSNEANPVVEETTIAHQWVFTAISSCNDSNGHPISRETSEQIVQILFALSRQGQKSKPKAKMLLTDFAKISKGEMSTEDLLTYRL